VDSSLVLRERNFNSSWLSALPIEEHGLLCTRGLLVMLCAFVMVGYLRVFHPNAFVAMDLMLTICYELFILGAPYY